MSSTTIRHSGVLENTQSAAHLATGQIITGQIITARSEAERFEVKGFGVEHFEAEPSERPSSREESVPRQRSPRRPLQYPPGFGPGEPHYEPAHLRHRPGDKWKIGGRPHDPEDPGPFGSPGWYQDRRTGRHRRAELPDPLPDPLPDQPPEADRDRTDRSVERSAEAPPHRFSRLREDAYFAFMRDSEELHRAHYETPEPSRVAIRLKWVLHVMLAVLYWRVIPFPESPARALANSAAHGAARRPGDGPGHGTGHRRRSAARDAADAVSGSAARGTERRGDHRSERRPARRPAPSPVPRLPQVRFGLEPVTGRVERRMIGGAAR